MEGGKQKRGKPHARVGPDKSGGRNISVAVIFLSLSVSIFFFFFFFVSFAFSVIFSAMQTMQILRRSLIE